VPSWASRQDDWPVVRSLGERMRGTAPKSAVVRVHEDVEIAAGLGGSLEHSCVAGIQMHAARDAMSVYRSRSSAWAEK
jgi:hypothetical protein